MKLTETMLAGLKKMATKSRRFGDVPMLPEPNENTGKALEKRGLIEFVEMRSGWRHYRITEAGRAALKEMGE